MVARHREHLETEAAGPVIRLRRPGGTVELWSQGENRYEVRAPGSSQVVTGFEAARDELARLGGELGEGQAPPETSADRGARLHERAEQMQLHAAQIHDDAATYWETRGYHAAAARERQIAQERREAARLERFRQFPTITDESAGTAEVPTTPSLPDS
jgi:hypothetical protein